MTPAHKAPKLAELAMHCNQGAGNVGALIKSLAEALPELEPFEAQYHPAIKFIISHLSFLCGESDNPSLAVCKGYIDWRDAPVPV